MTEVRILHVCLFNLCRSFLAERLTALELLRRDRVQGFRISSAGTQAIPGRKAHTLAQQALLKHGASADQFLTTRITSALLDDADLVLTATSAIRDEVISMDPGLLPRTFALKEFARLGTAVQSGAVDDVHGARSWAGYLPPGSDDIADPPATAAAFGSCASEVALAVHDVMELICSKD